MKVSLDKSDFNEWYLNVVKEANLCDNRYPIKGMNVWTAYGWKVMQNIDSLIRKKFDATGHDEYCFPLLIPRSEFQKEADHIKGFDAEVYWVTRSGVHELDEPLLLRPTSETAMYPMFKLWVRSHTDLPLKTYQLVNTFRYETKMTRPFIRVREIHFFESHTCHVDEEDAERQIQEDVDILEEFAKELCIPYLLCKRPEWDKFAGAFYTLGIDALLPTGRTLQLGSIHQYKTNFSEPYEIKYEDEKGEHQLVHQTTYGMSERLVGAVVAIHGDNKGLVLPPGIAPFQVVIVPIYAKGETEKIDEECRKLKKELEDAGIRVHLDLRPIRPGSKYYDWELKGVPLRLELGPRDLASESVVLVRRDTGEKSSHSREGLDSSIRDLLDFIAKNLLDEATKVLNDSITTVTTMEEGEEAQGIIRCGWCGADACADDIEKELDRGFLGIPWKKEEPDGPCPACGGPGQVLVYASKQV